MPSKYYRKEPRFVSVLTVRVSSLIGALDMMRYDSCYPFDEEDAHKLHRIGNDASTSTEDRTVRFIRVARNPSPATARRWSSRGCEIIDERSPEDR